MLKDALRSIVDNWGLKPEHWAGSLSPEHYTVLTPVQPAHYFNCGQFNHYSRHMHPTRYTETYRPRHTEQDSRNNKTHTATKQREQHTQNETYTKKHTQQQDIHNDKTYTTRHTQQVEIQDNTAHRTIHTQAPAIQNERSF